MTDGGEGRDFSGTNITTSPPSWNSVPCPLYPSVLQSRLEVQEVEGVNRKIGVMMTCCREWDRGKGSDQR